MIARVTCGLTSLSCASTLWVAGLSVSIGRSISSLGGLGSGSSVFHYYKLALRDVVTLWVECVFILDRNEGLAVFLKLSSWVHCRFQLLSQVGTGHVFLCSIWRSPSVLPFLILSFCFLLSSMGSLSALCGCDHVLGIIHARH